MPKNSGFTLIELSIVIVIVGLVAGGILVGRDLITAAEIRKQISQIEEFNTVVNVFREKYRQIPGDMNADEAYDVGFVDRSGAEGHGDGDGVIEDCDGTVLHYAYFGCEIILFWSDLSKAGLIKQNFSETTDSTLTNMTADEMAKYLPRYVMVDRGLLTVGVANRYQYSSAPKSNWFVFIRTTINLNGTGQMGNMPNGAQIYAPMAYIMDSKIDDGKPLEGKMRIFKFAPYPNGFFTEPPDPNPLGIHCVLDNGNYNIANNRAYGCHIKIKMNISN